MAISASPLLPVPSVPQARVIALRPVAAGDAGSRAGTGTEPQTEAEALREDELYRLHAERVESQASGGSPDRGRYEDHAEDDNHSGHYAGETPSFPGGTAAFMAQLFAADESSEESQDPFGDATRAYSRFREERHAGMVIDVRDPVDVEV